MAKIQKIGTLSIDSIFNPVTKVTYDVKPVPGAKEPIEILTMNVQTDGSISPKDAISYSATYIREHLKFKTDVTYNANSITTIYNVNEPS